MKFFGHKIKGVYEIILDSKSDDRGYFMRTFDAGIFNEHNLNIQWIQENQSFSKEKGIIRGLHFQLSPFTETKLVGVVVGKIYDVFVDLRKGSPTFGNYGYYILSDDKKNLAYIPRGFAHGFMTLTEQTLVTYKVDNVYSPEHESGIAWNDPDLSIGWPINDPILSTKDQLQKSFAEFRKSYGSINSQ